MENDKDKEILSPYTPDELKKIEDKLMDELSVLIKKYGYNDFAILVHKRNEITETCAWYPGSSCMSECLVDSLNAMIDNIEEEIKNHDHEK